MSALFERFKNGDKRTIVRRLRKGKHEFAGGEGVVAKRALLVPVTQEWRDGDWRTETWNVDSAVAAPTWWERISRWFKSPIPRARTVRR
jgi:hypothetical protein